MFEKIHTQENPADMLTKVVSGAKSTIVKTCPIFFQLREFDGSSLDELHMV